MLFKILFGLLALILFEVIDLFKQGIMNHKLAYGILNNILSWIGIGTYTKYAVQGMVFLLIVFINTYTERKLGRS